MKMINNIKKLCFCICFFTFSFNANAKTLNTLSSVANIATAGATLYTANKVSKIADNTSTQQINNTQNIRTLTCYYFNGNNDHNILNIRSVTNIPAYRNKIAIYNQKNNQDIAFVDGDTNILFIPYGTYLPSCKLN